MNAEPLNDNDKFDDNDAAEFGDAARVIVSIFNRICVPAGLLILLVVTGWWVANGMPR